MASGGETRTGTDVVPTSVGDLVVTVVEGVLTGLDFADAAPGPGPVESPRAAADVRRQLEEYFEGHRRRFDVPFDLGDVSGFDRDVLTALAEVPAGDTVAYGDLARLAGHPGAARAVGGACRRNPIAVVVPCHRVVPAGGGVGGYAGASWRKEALLRLEAGPGSRWTG